ncbi:hypothetical protein AAG570_011522 [Ranatra chinensis]|uniref:Inhibitor of apoptosis 2 n=1 Tax=Ranatra chinensis TaxID=642074 RepID=A0ABD0YKV8_9HEMI
MNYEESRLRSFENWPTNAAVDARRIAKAGFYYMGQGLEVQCFSCGVRIADWNYGDKVMARHRVLDPGCPFVINPTQSGNVPLVNDSRRIVTSQSDVNSSQRSSLSIPTHSRSARLRSFSNWPIPFIVSPEQLSQSGFFYTQLGDKVQCAYCNVLVERWEPGDEPDIEHVRHFPECPYMNRSSTEVTSPNAGINIRDFNTTGGLATLKELGIQSHRVPRHPKFATYESRHQTYCTWPKTLSQKPEDLADAGFFFTGQRDQVRCFHCDGGLKRWEKSDIPWQEHARWFPNCGFLLLVKGQQFVDETLLSHRTILNENGEHLPKPTSVGFTRVRTVTEEELQGLMSTPSAIAALQIGIEASRVKIALRQKMEQTGIPFSSADALIVAALGIQNEENLSQDIDETW